VFSTAIIGVVTRLQRSAEIPDQISECDAGSLAQQACTQALDELSGPARHMVGVARLRCSSLRLLRKRILPAAAPCRQSSRAAFCRIGPDTLRRANVLLGRLQFIDISSLLATMMYAKIDVPLPYPGKEGSAMRVLVVEDELRLATLLRQGLEEEGFAVDTAASAEEALDWIASTAYDLMLLDVMLPDISGFDLCRRLRSRGNTTPILVLTARDAVPDRVAGLDAGADDYLVKPFAFAELLARVRALARRPVTAARPVLAVGDYRLDPATQQVWNGELPVELGQKEFRILEYLMRNPNHVLTRDMIADNVWDYDSAPLTNAIDVHIGSLRRKLHDEYPRGRIETVRGAGYRLRSQP
jgi:two-component system OmpR family response regulator